MWSKVRITNAPFIPGIELSRRFYEEMVRPLLEVSFPDLPYAAALAAD